MYNYAQFTRFAACIAASVTLIACDAANITSTGEPADSGLIADDESTDTCAPIVVDLSGTRLLGHTSTAELTSVVPVTIPDGRYEIHLHYEDKYHSNPDDEDQLDEIWYLEGINISGEYALITNHTNDLPKNQTSGVTNVGLYDLNGIIRVNGRHASISHIYDSIKPRYNSIDPTMALFYPQADSCLEPS